MLTHTRILIIEPYDGSSDVNRTSINIIRKPIGFSLFLNKCMLFLHSWSLYDVQVIQVCSRLYMLMAVLSSPTNVLYFITTHSILNPVFCKLFCSWHYCMYYSHCNIINNKRPFFFSKIELLSCTRLLQICS